MVADPADLIVPDELLRYASADELALYERILTAEAAELPDAPKPLPGSPGALAAEITGGRELQSEHLNVLDEVTQAVSEGEDERFIIELGPRTGKTRRLFKWGNAWLLGNHPDWRVMHVSYGSRLAEQTSGWVRDMMLAYDLGARPRRDLLGRAEWEMDGYPESGMIALGYNGPATGKGCNVLQCDDWIKNAREAESKTYRDACYTAFTETFYSRLEPGGSVVIAMHRWHPDDLNARLKADDPNGWTVITLPTISTGEGDRLGRPRGVLIWPGRWSEERVNKQRTVLGNRFDAVHQQDPKPAKGGSFDVDRIRRNRVAHIDRSHLVRVGVGVDPSGGGDDEAGIIVGGRTAEKHYYVLEDLSGQMEPERWARTALIAALRWQAGFFVWESNLVKKMMAKVINQAWDRLEKDLAKVRAVVIAGELNPDDDGVRAALDLLVHGRPSTGDDDPGVEPMPDLDELAALVARQLAGDITLVKPLFEPVPAKVGKTLRAEPVSQLYSQDLVHHVGTFTLLEGEMTSWKSTDNYSPGRLDASVHLLTKLADLGDGAEILDAVGQPLPKPTVESASRSIKPARFGYPTGG